DGSAGAATVLTATDCDRLGGADGIAVDRAGGIVVATNRQNRIVRVRPDGVIATVADEGLDFPATLAYDRGSLYATSVALSSASAGKEGHPALVGIADAAHAPLH